MFVQSHEQKWQLISMGSSQVMILLYQTPLPSKPFTSSQNKTFPFLGI